ncbi:hypothetical protein FRC06_004868 [Ceratobasidium sp. 370]|nr:hypothetical protein FRC06_004868 [Ceratobasidium sp. 370]
MASSSKKGGKASVNASSFFDLKAELAKHEDAFAKSKLAGKGRAEPIVGGVKKDKDKKPAVWARQNKGVRDRAQRDVELEQPDDPNDPIVEYEDEFGRIRTARRSDVPRDRLPESLVTDVPADDEYVPPSLIDLHYQRHVAIVRKAQTSYANGRATHFPVYEPTAEKRAEVEESLVESSPFARYDASKDNRATGAGFYQFSADEEARAREMEELKRARVETVLARAEVEAEDRALDAVVVGEGGAEKTGRSRAVEKRRKELDERRQMLEAKRRKMLGGDDHAGVRGAEDFLASLEKDLLSAPTTV